MTALRWGVLGTGAIARTFARSLPESATGSLVAVGSRAEETAVSFGGEFGVDAVRCHGSYQALLDDDGVDAVYVATPHPSHVSDAVAAAKAGKHLLVEKPLGMSRDEVVTIVEAASSMDVFLMEAFMYRCHAQTARLAALVADGAIGDVRMVRASFGFHAPWAPASRLLDPVLGGGGILDVGCYPASLAVLVARVAGKLGSSVAVTGAGHVGSTAVDEWAVATVTFDGGLVAELSTGVQLQLDNAVEVFGSEGRLSVATPWQPREHGAVVLRRHGNEPESIAVPALGGLYAREADVVAEHVEARQAPEMPWSDSLAVAGILDQWLAAVGVSYPAR